MLAHLYLSPHLDDAVFSCGGLMAMQDARGEPISVLTLFAGDPPGYRISEFAAELHARWGKAGPPIATRRAEDRLACGRLGASVVHLDIPDAIYRTDAANQPLYPSTESLFAGLSPDDDDLLERLVQALEAIDFLNANVYCPMGLGSHVDHILTRAAAERLDIQLLYYADMPYAARGDEMTEFFSPQEVDWKSIQLTEEAIDAWVAAVLEYQSQLSTFWQDEDELYKELRNFHDKHDGIPLRESM
ncbi:MAG: PIG-L family deacetylase [Anaerolineales bacterium]|nr:PIG-L family deacetylase [Anaerolineales bacterium]